MSVDVTLDTLAKSKNATSGIGVKTLITSKQPYNFHHSTPSKIDYRRLEARLPKQNAPECLLISSPKPAPRNSLLNASVTSRDMPNIFRKGGDEYYRESIRRACAGVVRNSSLRSSTGN